MHDTTYGRLADELERAVEAQAKAWEAEAFATVRGTPYENGRANRLIKCAAQLRAGNERGDLPREGKR